MTQYYFELAGIAFKTKAKSVVVQREEICRVTNCNFNLGHVSLPLTIISLSL
jgi:hypothetical protein